jgi:hypothetical protein
LNGEAGVLLEGPVASTPFVEVRQHIASAKASSVQYDPGQRDAYAWWSGQFMDGLAAKFNDLPRDGEIKRTIVILAQTNGQRVPKLGDVIYFELPAAIGKVQSLSADVHMFLFDTLPASPFLALAQLGQARASFWCKAIGVEDDRGGKELRADWHISGGRPVLLQAPTPFRPNPTSDMQQVRVEASKSLWGDFDYLFGPSKPLFEPSFDRAQELPVREDFAERFKTLDLVPPEDLPWFRVTRIQRKEEISDSKPSHVALRKMTPQEGAFILMSTRRRKKGE